MANKIKELEKQILEHKALYYQGRPEISDHKYDQLEEQLKKFDPNNPILNIVGTELNSPDKIKHDIKMLSLNKTYKRDDLERWIGGREVVSTHKIDGVSGSLLYEDGELSVGKTRGNGQFGEDISKRILWIKNIPRIIKLKRCEVRGEICCDKKDFFKLSEEMVKLGLERPMSQRNIVAGLLGRKENIELCRYLSFFAFEVISGELEIQKEWDNIKLLEKLKFKILGLELHKSSERIGDVIKETESLMVGGGYLIDGVVFSYNDLKLHDELGSTAHHPRFKMAFKFLGTSKKTEIREIIWSVSRNGYLIPVADIRPVEIGGAKISRVTLHNYALVKQYELKRNDEIEIIRSGEVIPKFLAVIQSSSNKFEVPQKCPDCETKAEVEEVHLICPNNECPGRMRESILHFIQKIGIEYLSSKRLHAMLSQGLIATIPDLYRLDVEKLLTLERTKEKLAEKIFSEIKKSKSVGLVTFMSALGISGGAYNKCEKIVSAGFNTIEKLKKMSVEELSQVESFAEKSSREFINSFLSKQEIIKELMTLGLELKVIGIKQAPLTGKKIVMTGSLSRKRSDIENDVKVYGGMVLNSVSKMTNYLVTNDRIPSSTKGKKAKKLKIPIISEQELYEMMK